MKLTKNKKIILIIIFLLILIISFCVIISNIKKEKKLEKNSSSEEISIPLLGIDRMEATDYTSDLLNSYTSKVQNLLVYAKSNNLKEISLKEFSKTFNIDINEYENSKYECKSDTTMIVFKDNYDKYFYVFDCVKLYFE